MNKVLFLGDTPSKTNIDPNVAFIGAKCYPTLLSWIRFLGVTNYDLRNRIDEVNYSDYTKIVALGAAASKHLTQKNIHHCRIPHPSGLNRMLNDKALFLSYLEECREYLRN